MACARPRMGDRGPYVLTWVMRSGRWSGPCSLVGMAIEWIVPIPTTNYDPGRGGERVSFIVEHWTDARVDSAIARFMNASSRVSAHYIVAQDGRVLQLVSEDDTAFHA